MKSSLVTPVGLVLVLLGGVWFCQGIGWLGGSSMTGETLWTIIGPVVAAIGVVLIALGLRPRP
jgi:drug/metabolite transporter superfamily protein YnfA